MAKKTKRDDWFTNELAKQRTIFVSGSEDFSSRVKSAGLLTLRVFGHHPASVPPPTDKYERKKWLPPFYTIPFCILTCELKEQQDVSEFFPAQEEKIRNYIASRLKLPVYLVVYSADNLRLSGAFFVIDPDGQSRTVVPALFAEELNTKRNGRAEDEPEKHKELNKSENDVFQQFTRTLISWQYSINDVDALFAMPDRIALLELKRSSVNPWRPYLADVPNYLLMRSLSFMSDQTFDLTVHYDEKVEGKLDIHTISQISRDALPGSSISIERSDAYSAVQSLLNLVKDASIQPDTFKVPGTK
jgi:hypothetical protein